jgi:uncharacterized protein (TIGR02271 family)
VSQQREGTGTQKRFQKHMSSEPTPPQMLRIPVIQEELQIGRRVIDTGRGVRLRKTVTEEALRIDELLRRQDLQIEHIPLNSWVDGAPPEQRQEGATLIVPVLEEVLVVEKRLRLKEEIRITARSTLHSATEHVVVREEHLLVEPFDKSTPQRSEQEPPSG